MTLFLRAPISPLEPQHNHFTSLILAPKVILKPISLSDDPVDCLSLTPSLSTMPEEIVSHISRIVIDNGDGATVVRVNTLLNKIIIPSLYRDLVITSSTSLTRLISTLSQQPQLASHVRAITILPSKVDWKSLITLTKFLQPYKFRVDVLKVRFPASDLPHGLEFFLALSPESFEWITSPCWLIRPSDLFTRFLSHWPRLNFLKLGNFMFDMTFAHSITSISTLSTLTLLGSSNKNIDPQVLQLLLNHPILSRRLRLLELGDVPLLKRREIEDSLNNEEHRFSSRTSLGYINMGSDTISDPFQNVHSPGIRILDDATGNGGCSCLGLGCRSLDCYRKDCEWSKFQREKERHRHCNSRICPIYSYGTTVAEEEHQFRTFSSTSTSHSINIESSTSTSASIYSSTTSSSSPTESIPSLSSSPTSTFSTSHSSTSMRRFPSIQSCPFLNSRRSSSLLSSSQESSTYEMNWDSEWEFEETEDRMDWQSSPLGSMASGFASLGTGRRSSRKRSGVLRWIP